MTDARAAADALEALRARRPVLHILTSPVAAKISVDAALAVGAEPSLSADPGEIAAFMAGTDALLINLGMADPARARAATAALDRFAGPWVLDPVKIHRSAERRALAERLIARGPTLVKANADEQAALTLPKPRWITGAVDRIVDDGEARLANGHALMTRTTAIGCACGAVAAALLAVAPARSAAIAAAAICGVAGERAAAGCHGPGSFPAAWIDALGGLTPHALETRIRFA